MNTTTIYADNQSAIKLLKNPVSSNRAKHIDVMYHFAREKVASQEISYKFVGSEEMLADMLTKPVPNSKLKTCCDGIGLF
ncbi:hypothetical protein WJX84_007674 [Apatococcus fuscideae]|uniref:Copia protein n=1 Tax=Apatococcus fuscideae TaxID=2026836 RepID=A0AAW1RI85_9CHLO